MGRLPIGPEQRRRGRGVVVWDAGSAARRAHGNRRAFGEPGGTGRTLPPRRSTRCDGARAAQPGRGGRTLVGCSGLWSHASDILRLEPASGDNYCLATVRKRGGWGCADAACPTVCHSNRGEDACHPWVAPYAAAVAGVLVAGSATG